jgi:hypothetical protein
MATMQTLGKTQERVNQGRNNNSEDLSDLRTLVSSDV